MSEISFIPCELCDELISFEDYTRHIIECQRVYRSSFRNRNYNNNYVLINYRQRPNIQSLEPTNTSQQPPSQPPSQPPLQPTEQQPPLQPTEQQPQINNQRNMNTLLSTDTNSSIRTLETYLNRLIRDYNEDERIFTEEFNRLNRLNRFYNFQNENEHENENENDDTDSEMPSLIDENDEDTEEHNVNEEIEEDEIINSNIEILSSYSAEIDNMRNIEHPVYDISIEDNITPQLNSEEEEYQEETTTDVEETNQSSVNGLTRNNTSMLNSSNILPQIPPPPTLNYPERTIQSLSLIHI